MVTAELAVATLSALVLATLLCWGIYLVVLQMRCIDTAAEVARQAARGDQAGVQRAKNAGPAGARVTVTTSKAVVAVEVRLSARPFDHWVVTVPLHAEAQVVPEPGVAGRR
jgi:hypothetical protein